MMDLKSKKAIYVREHAPVFCRIQFICKGHLIHTRYTWIFLEKRIENTKKKEFFETFL